MVRISLLSLVLLISTLVEIKSLCLDKDKESNQQILADYHLFAASCNSHPLLLEDLPELDELQPQFHQRFSFALADVKKYPAHLHFVTVGPHWYPQNPRAPPGLIET
jgi:hypothetical protein